MTEQRISDIELVQDALNVAYSGIAEHRNTMTCTAESIKYEELPLLPRAFTSIKHSPPKRPRATWLDHNIPAPSSSSPESAPARGCISDKKTDRGGVHNGESQWMKRLGTNGGSDNLEACVIRKEQTLESTQDAYMRGAIQDVQLTDTFGNAFHDHSDFRSLDEEYKSKNTSGLSFLRPRPRLQLSVTGGSSITQLEPQTSVSNEQVLEEAQIQMLKEHGLRRTLRQVSPDLRKRSQWHAWKRAEEMLDKRDNVRASIENSIGWSIFRNPRVHVDATGVADDERQGQMWPAPPLVTTSDGAMSTLESGQISAISGGSAEMDISPEDHFSSQVIHCQQSRLNIVSTCDIDAGPEEHQATRKTDGSISLICESSTQSLDIGRGLSLDEFRYDRDYRGYYIRPVQTRVSSGQDDHHDFLRNKCDQTLETHENLEHVTTPKQQWSTALSNVNTPTYTLPIEHSHLKVPTTPNPLDRDVRPSVERDLEPRLYIRESTPVYVDRSFTPSPVSHEENAAIGAPMDTEMLDHDLTSTHLRIARETTPSSQSPLAGPMLPPPSPVRSLTNSPSSKAYNSASPSMLRSPAITRVIDQFQPSNWDTQFPVTRCDRSPSPSPYLRPQSSTLRHNSLEGLGQPSFDMSERPSVISRNGLTAEPLIPAPPPIPDEDLVYSAKRRKRDGRGKSAVQDTTAKVGKARSVTGGNGSIRGVRVVTAGKRQRVVTVGLAKALGEDVPALKGECEGLSQSKTRQEGLSEDRMDVDTDGASNVEEKGVPGQQGSQRRGQQLRRSTRLRVK